MKENICPVCGPVPMELSSKYCHGHLEELKGRVRFRLLETDRVPERVQLRHGTFLDGLMSHACRMRNIFGVPRTRGMRERP